MSDINKWANFLMNDKLSPAGLKDDDVLVILDLCAKLAQIRPPKIQMHKDKIESRRLVCVTAMEAGYDLAGIKRHGKMAMGRGLLDVWNEEYKKKFGTIFGTLGEQEVIRRGVSTENIKLRRAELEAAINESVAKVEASPEELRKALLKVMAMNPNMSMEHLAHRTGWTVEALRELINGKA